MASELIVRIGAKSDQFQSELEKVGKTTKNLEKQLANVAKISGAAFAAGTVAITATVAAAAKFEDKFTNVVTLLDKTSFKTGTLEQGMAGLRKGVLELGQDTGESFDSLNSALFDLISAGVPAGEAVDTLKVATQLAAAGATDTATAVSALTATMTAFGDKAGTAGEIAEKFFTAQKFGVTTVGELSKEFNKVAGLANNMGISFDEALASLSALTADGAKPTAEAATQLKAAMNGVINIQQNLSKESENVQRALSLQNIEQRGLVGALGDLKRATGGSVPEMKRLLGSSEALQAVLSLTGAQSELVATQMREMADAQKRAATFAEALATKQETTSKAMNKFSRVMETAAIVIGDQFAPIISAAADLLGGFFKVLVNNPMLAKMAALVLGAVTALSGFVATAALGVTAIMKIRTAMIALNITTKALGMSVKVAVGATGIGLLLIVAAELLARWETVWPAAVGIFHAFVKTITGLAGGIGKILKGIFTLDSSSISDGIDQAKDSLVNGMKDMAKAIKGDDAKATVSIEAKTNDEQVKKEAEDAARKIAEAKAAATPKGEPALTKDGFNADIEVTKHKEKEKKKTGISQEEADKRIQKNKDEMELLIADKEGATAKELEFMKRKNELETAEREASKIENQALRDSELELVRQKNEQLLAEQEEYNLLKQEQKLEQVEQEKEFQAVMNALDAETKAGLDAKEIEEFQKKIKTKKQIEEEYRKEKIEKEIKDREQFLKDEMKFGTTFAKMNQMFHSQEVQTADKAASTLIQLSQSKNETLKGIGKAAASTQAAIQTARGAISAYSALASIPIIGPGLGIGAAAAVIAYGAEQQSKILGANKGGRVPANMGIAGKDSVPAMLTPNELVVPDKNFDEVVGSVAAQRAGGVSGSNESLLPILNSINTKLDKLETPLTLNGDLLGDEVWVDRMIEGIREARENRNAKI